MLHRDVHFLKMAARLALRGHGGAEPNPLVGAVIVSSRGEVVGWGYHRTCGQAHAEVHALRRAGDKAQGATLYCTLEPCDHTGRTPPCTQAIIKAGIARVVIARRDPNPIAACGMARLQGEGIATEIIECPEAITVSDPFVHRLRTGLPWVTVKWAQTIDGKIATRSGESKWISNARSRRIVHRERGRVDAILTGIGTVKCDDSMLTARSGKPRRTARRVVIDPNLEIPLTAKLVTTALAAPTLVFCSASSLEKQADRARLLRDKGVEVTSAPLMPGAANYLALAAVLGDLVSRHDVANVLVEAGAGLMTGLFQQKLVNEAWVFIAPMLVGDPQAIAAVTGFAISQLTESTKLTLTSLRHRTGDLIARYSTKCPPSMVH